MDREGFIDEMKDKDRQKLLETWYGEYHKNTFGIGFHEAAGTTPNLAQAFVQWCSSTLYEKICVEWGYCQKKRSMGRSAQLATALADFLAPFVHLTTNGALSVAFLLVEYGFDSICDCDGEVAADPPSPAT